MSSAEAIAAVIADLKAGRSRGLPGEPKLHHLAQSAVVDPVVIDATAIHQPLIDNPDQRIAIYEDHPCIPPPFDEFTICYLNTYGNVIAIHITPDDPDAQWDTSSPVEWERVRWRLRCFLWIGGHGGDGEPVRTTGPMWMWRVAVYDDGQPADVTWLDLADGYEAKWDNAMLVMLGALNFLGCRNVALVEPQRPRSEWRRLARIGDGSIRVKTIQVFPIGKSVGGSDPTGVGVPLTTVRGHMAHYGPRWGKGLLFGKYEGRFWVAQHARGDRAHGETRNTYELSPE